MSVARRNGFRRLGRNRDRWYRLGQSEIWAASSSEAEDRSPARSTSPARRSSAPSAYETEPSSSRTPLTGSKVTCCSLSSLQLKALCRGSGRSKIVATLCAHGTPRLGRYSRAPPATNPHTCSPGVCSRFTLR
jgi:hypothetical protein